MHTIHSSALTGFEATPVVVEVATTNSLPTIAIVGLGHKTIEESKERIRSALRATGVKIPTKKIIINLAPSDLPKHGTYFDLAIAVSIMRLVYEFDADRLDTTNVVGEVSLDGGIKHAKGIYAHVKAAEKRGATYMLCPVTTPSFDTPVQLIRCNTLADVIAFLGDGTVPDAAPVLARTTSNKPPNFDTIFGHHAVKRALMIALVGGHNIHLTGPPGSGKSALARATASYLPSPEPAIIHELSHIYDLAHEPHPHRLPFRSPHHSASRTALVGGGMHMRPGEISLAHHGILHLDELPEFTRDALESLRQPLEDREITINRASQSTTFPASVQVIATSNPCPCGYANHPQKQCNCPQASIDRYRKKLSGPLLDRFDITYCVQSVEASATLRRPTDTYTPPPVLSLRKKQHERQGSLNSVLTLDHFKQPGILSAETRAILETAAEQLSLSTRSILCIMRVAQTIADMDESPIIQPPHLTEAIAYKNTD